MTTPAPPAAMIFPNSSSTSAVPYTLTDKIAFGEACEGETPAAWITAKLTANMQEEVMMHIQEQKQEVETQGMTSELEVLGKNIARWPDRRQLGNYTINPNQQHRHIALC